MFRLPFATCDKFDMDILNDEDEIKSDKWCVMMTNPKLSNYIYM